MGHSEDVLTDSELHAFANIYADLVRARQLLTSVGIPSSRLPSWAATDSWSFWHEVNTLLQAGIVRDGRRRLLAAAATDFPANPVFGSPRAAEPATAPPSTAPPSTESEAARKAGPAADVASADNASPTWDFHVSYAPADEGWARWIDWVLEDFGYKVNLKARELVAGQRAVQVLEDAVRNSRRTIVVLSRSYLDSPDVQAHWQTAWASDPGGIERALLPVRVEKVRAEGLLGGITYIDLTGELDTGAAAERLLAEVKASLDGRRSRSTDPPPFPGAGPGRAAGPPFPGDGPVPPYPGGS